MNFSMLADIIFDRPIKKDLHYISPGGYEMVFNGKIIHFDFEDYEGWVDKKNPALLHIIQRNPDYSSFEDLNSLEPNDLLSLKKINEFFIYTGEAEDPEINPIKIEKLEFCWKDGSGEYTFWDYSIDKCVSEYKFT